MQKKSKQAEQISPCNTDEEYRKQGNTFFFHNQFELAKQCYVAGLSINANNARLCFNLAVTCGYLREYEEAIVNFNKVIALDSNYSDFTRRKRDSLAKWIDNTFDHKDYISVAQRFHQILIDNPTDRELVETKRKLFCEWGISLKDRSEKERFNKENYLTQAFDREALELIQALLIHDEFCSQYDLEDEEKKLKTIGNICLTLACLSKNFRAKYIDEINGFEYCIWDDLVYLGLSTFDKNNLLYSHRITMSSEEMKAIHSDLHHFVLPFIQKILRQTDIHRLAAIELELEKEQEPLNLINEQLEDNAKNGFVGISKKIKRLQDLRNEAQAVLNDANQRIPEIKKDILKLEKEISDDQKYLEENKAASQGHYYKGVQRELKLNRDKLDDKKEKIKEWSSKKEKSTKNLADITENQIGDLIKKQTELTEQKKELEQKKQLLLDEQKELKRFNFLEARTFFSIINRNREEKVLKKIIEYCHVNSDEDYRRESVLRRLFFIGEQLNKQKLTPQTKNFLIETAKSMNIKIDWIDLNLIRNRLAHPENDIYALTLRKYVKKDGLRKIIEEDLPNIEKVILKLLKDSRWEKRNLSYYESLKDLDKQPEDTSMNSLQSLKDHMPNEAMHQSEIGRKFRRENQLYIVELILEEIDEIERLLGSATSFDENALIYALNEDQVTLTDIEFINQLCKFQTKRKEELKLTQKQIMDYHGEFLISIPRPSSVARGHMERQTIDPFLNKSNANFYIESTINYGKLCYLYNELRKKEHIQYAIEYHLSLIEEYFKLIEHQYRETILPKMILLEAHMHRNAMGHGETYFDLMPQIEMHIHYAIWYRQNIKPAFLQIKENLQANFQQFNQPLPDQEEQVFSEFLQTFESNQSLKDMIGGFVEVAQRQFIYSSNGFLRTEQRQTLFFFIAQLQKMQILKEHNHQYDNSGLNALEFDRGIVILPELITTDGESGIQIQLTNILNYYASHLKPIYLCINQSGYHYTTLVIVPHDDKSVEYRYIDPMISSDGEWIGLSPEIQRGLEVAIRTSFPNGTSVIHAAPYINQQDSTGNHNNECGFHNIYYTLYMLMTRQNAALSQMRDFFATTAHPILGNNVSYNGGIDAEDSQQFIRPWFQRLFYKMLCLNLSQNTQAQDLEIDNSVKQQNEGKSFNR